MFHQPIDSSTLYCCCLCFRNVFKPFSGELDMHADFVLYRADSMKMTEEELLKQLADLKRFIETKYHFKAN